MAKTIKEQLLEAKKVYLVLLNNPKSGDSTFRYAAYTLTDSGLEVVWPSDTHVGKCGTEYKDAGMTHSNNKSWPAFHFAMRGYGYSKQYEVKLQLEAVAGKRLDVEVLSGWSPSKA